MEKKKIIRLVCAVGSAVSAFILTRFLGHLVIGSTLGNTAYAVSAPLMLPLEILAALSAAWLFVPRSEKTEDYEEDEYIEELEEIYASRDEVIPELDESAYPELFKKQTEAEETADAFIRPDIKKLLHEQSGKIQNTPAPEEKEDILGDIPQKEQKDYSLYEDIPAELPEDYVPYEYEEEEDSEEEYDEEEYELPKIPAIAVKATVMLVASLLAVILPVNTATVYYRDKVAVRRPFSVKEYYITDAEYYTVGVKLTGDVSMKLSFSDDSKHEFIVPSSVIKSESFKESFSSGYGYAAFCSRLLNRSYIEKRFDDLTSLSPPASLSQSDMAYIEEITETEIDY